MSAKAHRQPQSHAEHSATAQTTAKHFHSQWMCGLLLSERSWLAEAGELLPPSREHLLWNFSWDQVGRFWIILPSQKLLERASRSPPVVSLIELLQDETANQLISESVTPVFEWLQRGRLGCADVCVSVCVLGLRPKYTELHRCCSRIVQSLLRNIVVL